jgi:Tfp pilus assembly protein PilF
MRMKWIMPAVVAGCVAVGAVTGCQEQNKKQTIKQKAEAQWNGARATVLLSLATDQYKAGNFDKARQSVDDAAKLQPNAAPILVLRPRSRSNRARSNAPIANSPSPARRPPTKPRRST